MEKNIRLEIFKTAALSRAFEEETYKRIQNKEIGSPVYMSAGQEFISATLANVNRKVSPKIFAQHRAHSTYLAFGGDMDKLILELMGDPGGCAGGKGGSASIHCPEISMFGHDGLMGSQVPIGVGHCFVTREPTIIFMGDASAEEDYSLASIGWAATKKLPILFVVEDNNLSILTEKKMRRSWSMTDVASGMGIQCQTISDSPEKLYNYAVTRNSKTKLINVETNRLFWHAGAGKDSDDIFDRLEYEKKVLGSEASEILDASRKKVKLAWNRGKETAWQSRSETR